MALEDQGEGASATKDPLVGTRYRTVKRLGGGVASDVLEVLDPTGDRRAVKLLASAFLGTREVEARFEREARALRSLSHPRVVPLLDAGATPEGRPFFAMPLLDGETLRERLARARKLPISEAINVVCDVLEALDAAHAEQIVHRDVKPGNIFLLKSGRATVLDFGIAKLLAHSEDLTSGAHVVGSPRYLAPEQVLGGAVDARTDVYATALVAFEAIAGRGPFDARGPMSFVRAAVADAPRRLSEVAEVSPAMERVIARALEKSPAKRWPSARSFASALRVAEGAS